MESLSHHVIATSFSDLCQDECLHIAAMRYITEEIDATHGISPDLDFTGDYNKNADYLTALTFFTDHAYHATPKDPNWEVGSY